MITEYKKRSEIILDYIIAKFNLNELIRVQNESSHIEKNLIEYDLIAMKIQIDDEIVWPIYQKYYNETTPIGFVKCSDSTIMLVSANLETLEVYTKMFKTDNPIYISYQDEIKKLRDLKK